MTRVDGAREGDPLAHAAALVLGALLHDGRVEADARVVDEDAAVELADVDQLGLAVDDRLYRRVEVERNADVLGEVIERAERQHAERGLRADERRGDGAHRAVAAGGDDGAAAALRIAAGDGRQLAAVSRRRWSRPWRRARGTAP